MLAVKFRHIQPDHRVIIVKQELGQRTADLQNAAIEKMKGEDVNVWEPTAEQRKAWADSLGNLPKERYAEIEQAGQPAEAIYEYIRLLKEAGYEFPRDWAAER